MTRYSLTTLALIVGSSLTLGGCWSTDDGSDDSAEAGGSGGGQITLTGAGATFPYPIYARWFSLYSAENPVRVNYQSIGSGGGIRQMIEGTVDFGATDAPLTEEDLAQIPGTLSIPMVIGSVAITYNLPEVTTPLRLDAEVLAGVFLGDITQWQDPRILALNPGVNLPDRDIISVHRSDGSGTTYVFTDYLSEVSPRWQAEVGRGNAVRWPSGLGARGNEGVTGQIVQTEGAIGYVEQIYARQTDLPMTALQNRSGSFVSPSIEATSAAAEELLDRLGPESDFRLSIVNASSPDAYPIASWTYLLVSPHFPDCRRAETLLDLIQWAFTEGTDDAIELNYAPLTVELRARALSALKVVTCGPGDTPVIDPQVDFEAELVAVASGGPGT